jgi:hypothetical protein
LCGPLAAGTERWLLWVRIAGGIVLEVLLEEGNDELLSQLAGTLLALVEGDEIVGDWGIEQKVEGGPGLVEELLAQLRARRVVVHDGTSWRGDE